jgi:hypothetical protein
VRLRSPVDLESTKSAYHKSPDKLAGLGQLILCYWRTTVEPLQTRKTRARVQWLKVMLSVTLNGEQHSIIVLTINTLAMRSATLASSSLVDQRNKRPSPILILSGRICVSPAVGCGYKGLLVEAEGKWTCLSMVMTWMVEIVK